VVEVGVPVQVHRAGDVAGGVQQHVLVRLDHRQPRVTEVLGEPGGRDEPLRVRVLGETGLRISGNTHAPSLPPRMNVASFDLWRLICRETARSRWVLRDLRLTAPSTGTPACGTPAGWPAPHGG